MAQETGIAWTDSTFNIWIGCTKVSPACDNCYAESLDARHKWGGATHWGPGVPRKVMSEGYWAKPLQWNRMAEKSGKPWRVFCSSLADVFDNEAPEGQRERLWDLICATPHLTWQLVTKRIGNARKMLPADWGAGYPNVWLISTLANQEEVSRDAPKLIDTPAVVHGVSYEPALGPVDWRPWFAADKINWLIIGGESAQNPKLARRSTAPFVVEWAEDVVTLGEITDTAVFVKQLGALPSWRGQPLRLRDRVAGASPEEWPQHLRVRQFPRGKI